jgi:outer membrane protein
MNKKLIIIASIAGLVLLSAITWKTFKPTHKVAYVKLNEVYDKFSMKVELENKFKTIESVRKNLIDSIEFNATQLQNNQELYKEAVSKYIQKRKELESANKVLLEQYEESIWAQINSYSESFGKEKGYEYILGADGSGIIMFASEKNDVTTQFIEYINEMYNGKQKNTQK